MILRNTKEKPKALLFLPYLAPYRVDALNEIGKYYDLTVVFLLQNMFSIKFDQNDLSSRLEVKFILLSNGFNFKKRQIRFGIFKLINQHKPEVIFSNEYGLTSLLISIFKKLHFFKFIHISTTSDNVYMAQSTRLVRSIARKFVLSSAQGLIVYNMEVCNWYQKKFKELKIGICPNIQLPQSLLKRKNNLDQIAKKYIENYGLKDKIVYLFIGRFHEMKGLKQLINIFNRTKQSNEILILVGDGTQREEIIQLIKYLKINNDVILPGKFDSDNLYAWYNIASLFILPSIHEPFGAVINESLILGTPVLCSSFAGANYFVKENINGLTFDPTDENDFINKFDEARKLFANFNLERENLMAIEFESSIQTYYTVFDELRK
jgi:glycosyltransferase involved in cell wall biosynthesis